jgi:hypothetical protein
VRLHEFTDGTHIHIHTTALEQRRLGWVPGWDVRRYWRIRLRAANVVLTDGILLLPSLYGEPTWLPNMRILVLITDEMESARTIRCRQLVWGVSQSERRRSNIRLTAKLHLVLGSDIIYVEEILDPLCFQSVDRLLADGGEFLARLRPRNVKIDLVLGDGNKYVDSFTRRRTYRRCLCLSTSATTTSGSRGHSLCSGRILKPMFRSVASSHHKLYLFLVLAPGKSLLCYRSATGMDNKQRLL